MKEQKRCFICGRFVRAKPYSLNICTRHGLAAIHIPLETEVTKERYIASTKRD